MDMEQIQMLERIDPQPLEPWRQPVFEDINIDINRETTIRKVDMLMIIPETVIYSDASAKQSTLNAAVVVLDQHTDM
jgi:hypothetical protein